MPFMALFSSFYLFYVYRLFRNFLFMANFRVSIQIVCLRMNGQILLINDIIASYAYFSFFPKFLFQLNFQILRPICLGIFFNQSTYRRSLFDNHAWFNGSRFFPFFYVLSLCHHRDCSTIKRFEIDDPISLRLYMVRAPRI